MIKKVFRSNFLTALVILVITFVLILEVAHSYVGKIQKDHLRTELTLAVAGVEQLGNDYLKNLEKTKDRFTLIATDGSVIHDTHVNIKTMENHADREEISEALQRGNGSGTRISKSLTEETFYFAKKLSNGEVLRVSATRMSVWAFLLSIWHSMVIVLVIAVIASYILAKKISAIVVKPLNNINLDEPLKNDDSYDEIAPLLTRIAHQQRELEKREVEISKKKNEFQTVIQNMNEGMVLIGSDGGILSINAAACEFFGTKSDCIGRQFINIERNRDINSMLEKATAEGASNIIIERISKEYMLNATAIKKNDEVVGMTLLIFDESEKANAERTRREFTANVVHELKTPLHTIMGNAELISSGMATADKVPEFAVYIHDEAAKLLSIIEDIMRLSKLDERAEFAHEIVRLGEFLRYEVKSFENLAEEKAVAIELDGEEVEFFVAPQLLHEICYNIIENAIKYNRNGGRVSIAYAKEDENACFKISDNGIGIPVGHQSRIFERFYRVDKSHSRNSGGTGLGLSIVKHAVAYLGGNIKLESSEGIGTSITVTLPIGKQ